MSQGLMDMINELVEIESQDAVESWTGSDQARAAHAAIEARIEAIRDAAIQIGVDGETISALLDGDES